MIDIKSDGGYFFQGQWLDAAQGLAAGLPEPRAARERCMSPPILRAHSEAAPEGELRLHFDLLASHDITYVGIIQTARASGLESFALPYILTNCHNSLCAVGGTINEDDHLFGLSAARKYGGEYVPAHLAVIHQYMREMHAGGGRLILGSDSHSRYGALGCMGFGEGGPELVKQLLGRSYDLPLPRIAAIYLEGAPGPGVGPQDLALVLIRALFPEALVKNMVLEFFGPGLESLSMDYRLGLDVMSTESACLSSIWQCDARVGDWLALHGRKDDYRELRPGDGAWYDLVVRLDLGAVEPMIALPFHPARAWSIREFLACAPDMLRSLEKEAAAMLPKEARPPDLVSKFRDGAFFADQGLIAGCAGGLYENMAAAAVALKGKSTGDGAFALSLYPASQPLYLELMRSGLAQDLIRAGVLLKSAFCGPCFGAGEVPANNAFSLRHTTRNFPNREGSSPGAGQMAYVALMDARSIAATAARGGKLTSAADMPEFHEPLPSLPAFDKALYRHRVYRGFGRPHPEEELKLGPNIADWPALPPLPDNLLLFTATAIYDPVTTTDELIPSGETSSLRSNPLKLARFTLSRKDPGYLERALAAMALESARRTMTDERPAARGKSGSGPDRAEAGGALKAGDDGKFSGTGTAVGAEEVRRLFASLGLAGQEGQTGIGSLLFALRPGDGSAREQAASCQKVLGAWANIAVDYATRRYRSNLINWGLLPFVLPETEKRDIEVGDLIFLPGLRQALTAGLEVLPATLYRQGRGRAIRLTLPGLGREERAVILAGCLINYYRERKAF